MEKCTNCREKKNCDDSVSSWIFFIVGLVATVAIRVVTVLMRMNPLYGKIAWYTGIGGFLVFFVYKFKIGHRRSRIIEKHDLVNKIERKEKLSDEDYGVISEILCALSSHKERINYFFIFAFSAIALLVAVYLDFLK